MKRIYFLLATLFLGLFALAARNDLAPKGPDVIQPEDLAKTLQSAGKQKPVILYVGPHIFYSQAHIQGAEDMGPAAQPEGMEKLRAREKSLLHDASVVIYCGCCPWDHCPNIEPAYHELRKAGFAKVRVLYLAISFGENWVDKGYPVDRSN